MEPMVSGCQIALEGVADQDQRVPAGNGTGPDHHQASVPRIEGLDRFEVGVVGTDVGGAGVREPQDHGRHAQAAQRRLESGQPCVHHLEGDRPALSLARPPKPLHPSPHRRPHVGDPKARHSARATG